MNAAAFWWAILTACIWGVVPLLEKFGLGKVEPMVGLFYRCIGVVIGIIFLGAMVMKTGSIKTVDGRSALALVVGGLLASFVAQIAFYHSLKAGEMSRVVPLSGSYPLITCLLGVAVLHEALTPLKLLGVLCIIAGIWCIKGS